MALGLAFRIARAGYRWNRGRKLGWTWRDGLTYRKRGRKGYGSGYWYRDGGRQNKPNYFTTDEDDLGFAYYQRQKARGIRYYRAALIRNAPVASGKLRRSIRVSARWRGNKLSLRETMIPYGRVLSGRRGRRSYRPQLSHKASTYRFRYTRGWIPAARRETKAVLASLGIVSSIRRS